MVVPVMSSGRAAYAVYCYDVTERKEFENMLEASQQMAEAANQAKSDFLANMSHELRTPMNGIIGLSGILAKMNLGAEAQELSGAVHHSARNLLTLLNDILDFSKIEAGELSLENIPFDMRATVDQVVRLQENVATSKHLTLNAHIASDVPHYLMGDPIRLQQILNNLVSNALKFTDTGTVDIHVGATHIKDNICHMHISVHDTGIGIAADQQDAVFKKFTQADISTSRKYGGTGLGLTITRQLVGMMGGAITLQSKVGEGTIFDVKIPLPLASHRANIQNIEQPKTLVIHAGARVLVVDDHPVNLLFMRRILGSFGVQNITDAKSGRDALALLDANEYDLILLDCQMPEMDGFEVARFIRTGGGDKSRVIIIAVTADAMKGAQEKCLSAGMNDYLSKPIDPDSLHHILQKFLPDQGIFRQDKLDEFTDGDPSKENEIISLFSTITRESLMALEHSIQDDDPEEWKNHTHKLYSSSATFGATAFADICDEAQGLYSANTEEKKAILEKIMLGYRQLDEYLQQRRSA